MRASLTPTSPLAVRASVTGFSIQPSDNQNHANAIPSPGGRRRVREQAKKNKSRHIPRFGPCNSLKFSNLSHPPSAIRLHPSALPPTPPHYIPPRARVLPIRPLPEPQFQRQSRRSRPRQPSQAGRPPPLVRTNGKSNPATASPQKSRHGHSKTPALLLLCMSANAFGSDWTQLESHTFRFRDPLNKDRRFIPLRLDDTPIKGSLAQFLYINWLPASRDQEYPKLLEACQPPPKLPQLTEAQQRFQATVLSLGHTKNVLSVAWSPDGRRALSAGRIATPSGSGTSKAVALCAFSKATPTASIASRGVPTVAAPSLRGR